MHRLYVQPQIKYSTKTNVCTDIQSHMLHYLCICLTVQSHVNDVMKKRVRRKIFQSWCGRLWFQSLGGGKSNKIQTILQNPPVQSDIISHDASRTTSSFLGWLEKCLDFTELILKAGRWLLHALELWAPPCITQRSLRSCWHTTPFQFQTVTFRLTSAAPKLFTCQTWWSRFFLIYIHFTIIQRIISC